MQDCFSPGQASNSNVFLQHLRSGISSPEAVQNVSIRIDPEHDVVCGSVMDERTFGVDEKNIWNPDLFHQASIESHALIGGAGEGQALVLPVVPQV